MVSVIFEVFKVIIVNEIVIDVVFSKLCSVFIIFKKCSK